MNNETKILLTIQLEGGTLQKGEPEVKKYYLTKKDLFPHQRFKGTSGSKVIRSGKYIHIPVTQSVAQQVIKMTKDAYNYMTSTEVPSWYIPFKPLKARTREWSNLTPTQRLELHLARTCRHLGGKTFSYKIIDD